MVGIDQDDPYDPRGAGREQGLERPRGGPEVRLALLLDQHVLEAQVAVPGQIEIAEAAPLQQGRALGADVRGYRDRVGFRHLPSDLGKAGHCLPDLTGLADRSDTDRQGVWTVTHLEFHQQISGLSAYLHVDKLLPPAGFRHELAHPLRCQGLDIVCFRHSFTSTFTCSFIFSVC
jgi:hypothetical protein